MTGRPSGVAGDGPHAHRDFFICHAEEDKAAIARPLYDGLVGRGFSVWLDEVELTLGDSLRQRIDHGLANCRFGIVVLSKAFFSKNWPQYELDGLMTRQMSGTKTVLPVWHDIGHGDVASRSPSLAGLLAANTARGVAPVVDRIVRAFTAATLPSEKARPQQEPSYGAQRLSWSEVLTFPLSDAGRAQLLRDRPDAWEYLLFADALARGLLEHEPAWRDHELRLVRPNGRHVVDDDVGTYLARACHDIADNIGNVERLLSSSSQAGAFGDPGESGDPMSIEHLCQRLMAIYGQCLEWAADVRSTRTSDEFKRLLELVAMMADEPISQIRGFVDRCTTEVGRIPMLLASPGDEPITIRLNLVLTTDDDLHRRYKKELRRVARRKRWF